MVFLNNGVLLSYLKNDKFEAFVDKRIQLLVSEISDPHVQISYYPARN